MDVRLSFDTQESVDADRATLDHTKYIGKSSSNPVSEICDTFSPKDLMVACRVT